MKRNKKIQADNLQELSDELLEEEDLIGDEIEEEAPPKKKRWKKILLSILLTLLGLAVVAVLAVVLYVNHLLNQLTPYDTVNDVTLSSSEAEQIIMDDPDGIVIDPEQEDELPNIEDLTFPNEIPVDQGDSEGTDGQQPTQNQDTGPAVNWDNVVNILLIGQDRRPGQGRQRSDSMMLLTFNKSKKTITLTSFMRDAHVRIPGYKSNKLNATYAFGGMSLLNKTLEQNYGVHIDGDIEVDFNNFKKIIDLLGGVDIKLTEKETTYLNNGLHLKGTSRELTAGTQRLDGEIALAYSRIRELDSDYRRAERQRKVISSLIQRYKNQSVGEMLGMLEDILPLVVTNMDKGQIVDYTMELVPMLAGSSVNTLRIPADGTFRQGIVRVRSGLAAWFQYDIDFYANRRILNEIFAE